MKKYEEAFHLLEITNRHMKDYAIEFPEITKKLKEKGSKFKFFHMKNKLTGHSRANPDLLKMLVNMTYVKVLMASSKSLEKYN